MQTPRYALPTLSNAQAHKEITHNEALFLIDFLLHPVAQSRTATPPTGLAATDAGKCWIVGNAAVGAWAGQDKQLACWSGDGMRVTLESANTMEIYLSNQWVSAPVIANPTGGSTIDTEARTTLIALLARLRQYGIIAI
jgi:hypothetical protein